MNCEQIRDQLTPYLLGDLDEKTSAEIRAHLEKCDGCRALAREVEPTLDLLRDALAATSSQAPAKLSPDHRRKIRIESLARRREKGTVISWITVGHPAFARAAVIVFIIGVLSVLSIPVLHMMSPKRAMTRSMVEPTTGALPLDLSLAESGVEQAPGHKDQFGSGGAGRQGMASGEAAASAEPIGAEWKEDSVSKSQLTGSGKLAAPAEPEMRLTDADFDGKPAASSGKAGKGGWPSGGEGAQGKLGAGGGDSTYGRASGAAVRKDGAVDRNRKALDVPKTVGMIHEDEVVVRVKTAPAAPAKPPASVSAKETTASMGVGGGVAMSAEKATSMHDSFGAPEKKKLAASQPQMPASTVAQPAAKAEADKSALAFYKRDEGLSSTTEKLRAVNGEAGASAGAVRAEKEQRAAGAAVQPQRELRQDAQNVKALGDIPATGQLGAKDSEMKTVSESVLPYEYKAKAVTATARKEEKPPEEELTGPRFKATGVNPFVKTAEQPFSTFSIGVDTASYTLMRNYMLKGYLPPAESVRTEEFVNFFDYAYKAPARETFRVYVDTAPSKFGHGLHLMKIGVKGRRLGREEQRRAMLTFLIDTSGSMDKPDRLGLVKKSLRLLIEKMAPQDMVAIVQFDSHARLVLEFTTVADKKKILEAIDALQCGGSTNLEEGMMKAYELAAKNFAPGGENRVLLLSDGVANLGTMAAEDILKAVERYRKQGIYCSVFGVGMGTYDDTMLQNLADKGDGTYAFIDSEDEAKRVFVDDLSATLNTIAKDVKIQVEFNPRAVTTYRQLGYESRQLKKEDFRNDAVDAGEVGSGQSVTALYEMEIRGQRSEVGSQRAETGEIRPDDGRIATVRVRYRRTDNDNIEEIEQPVKWADVGKSFDEADVRFRLAAGVAQFSEILRGSPFAQGREFKDVADVLRPVALELNLDNQVQELLRLIGSANGLSRAPLSE